MTAPAKSKYTLTVMTLNLCGANRWADRRSAVVDWVNESRPDLLALQEVVRSADTAGVVDRRADPDDRAVRCGNHRQRRRVVTVNPFAAAEHEPDRRIDYTFTGIQVLSAHGVCDAPRNGVWPSDHFGVAATVRLPDRQ